MDQNQTNRPEKVGTAVKLLYISLGVGVLQRIMMASVYAELPHVPNNLSVQILVMLVAFFVLGIRWLFIYMIGKGRNWARIVFLVWFIIVTPVSMLIMVFYVIAFPLLVGLPYIVQTVIQVIALVFLFRKPSTDWFREMKMTKN